MRGAARFVEGKICVALLAFAALIAGCPESSLDDDDPPPSSPLDIGVAAPPVDAGDDAEDDAGEVTGSPGIGEMPYSTHEFTVDEAGFYAVALLEAGGGCPEVESFGGLYQRLGDLWLGWLFQSGGCPTGVYYLRAGTHHVEAYTDSSYSGELEVWTAPARRQGVEQGAAQTLAVEAGSAVVLEFGIDGAGHLSLTFDAPSPVCGGSDDPHFAAIIREPRDFPGFWVTEVLLGGANNCAWGNLSVSDGRYALVVVALPHQNPMELVAHVEIVSSSSIEIGDVLSGNTTSEGVYHFHLDDLSWVSLKNTHDLGAFCPLLALYEVTASGLSSLSGTIGTSPTDACGEISLLLLPGDYLVDIWSEGEDVDFVLETSLAEPIPIGSTLVADGSVSGWTDLDVYSFEVEAPGLYRFLVQQDLGICDGSLRAIQRVNVYATSQESPTALQWVLEAYSYDDVCFATSRQLEPGLYLATLQGTEGGYRIGIATTEEVGGGESCDRIGLRSVCHDNTLCLMTETAGEGICGHLDTQDATPEFEPNQTIAAALVDVIAPPARRAGSITAEDGGDAFDLFIVDLVETSALRVATFGESLACEHTDTLIYRVDADLFEADEVDLVLGTDGVLASDDQQPDSNCAVLTELLPAGRHYFVISSFAQAFGFDYEVAFSVIPAVEQGGRCDPRGLETLCPAGLHCVDVEGIGDGACASF